MKIKTLKSEELRKDEFLWGLLKDTIKRVTSEENQLEKENSVFRNVLADAKILTAVVLTIELHLFGLVTKEDKDYIVDKSAIFNFISKHIDELCSLSVSLAFEICADYKQKINSNDDFSLRFIGEQQNG